MGTLIRAWLCFVGVSAIWVEPALGNEPILVSKSQGERFIGHRLQYLRVENTALTLGEALEQPFRPLAEDRVSFGPVQDAIWLRFQIRNDTDHSQNLVFNIRNPIIEEVTFYSLEEGVLRQSVETGFSKPYRQREINDRHPLFSFAMEPEQELTIVTRLYGDHPIFLTPLLMPLDQYMRMAPDRERIWGIYVGIILVMVIYNLFVFVSTWDTHYLYYVLAIMFLQGFTFWHLEGLTPHFLFPDSPDFHKRFLLFAFGFGTVAGVRFFQLLIQTRDSMPRIHQLSTLCAVVLGICCIVPIFYYHRNFIHLLNGVASIAGTLALSGSLIATLHKQRSAAIFLTSWLFLIVTGMSHTLMTLGLLPHSWMATYGYHIGSVIEVILLSTAVSDRLNYLNSRQAAMDKDMALAKAVQETLVSTVEHPHLDIAAYYQPAEKIGGDWYSFYQDKDGPLFFVFCGDVTGHGFPAALMTGVVAGSVESFMTNPGKEDLEPDERLKQIIESLNMVIYKTGNRQGQIMTFVAVAVDTHTGEFWICNAGHPPVMHVEYGKEKVKRMSCASPLLGFAEEPDFRSKRGRMAPGDALIIYTDGLFENSGPTGKVLNPSHLRSALPKIHGARALVDSILAEGAALWQSYPPEDDCTVVALTLQKVRADSPQAVNS